MQFELFRKCALYPGFGRNSMPPQQQQKTSRTKTTIDVLERRWCPMSMIHKHTHTYFKIATHKNQHSLFGWNGWWCTAHGLVGWLQIHAILFHQMHKIWYMSMRSKCWFLHNQRTEPIPHHLKTYSQFIYCDYSYYWWPGRRWRLILSNVGNQKVRYVVDTS